MKEDSLKLTKLHDIIIAIKDLSIKIDNMKKERQILVDEFKKVQDEGTELKKSMIL